MNARQTAFHRQASSDWELYSHLVAQGAFPVCHALHFLQMCTEKLAKAYYTTPPRGHAAFTRFLTDLPRNPAAAAPLGFPAAGDLTRWQLSVNTLVTAIENLAPQLADANNLPNPEYPWPRGAETTPPADYSFQVEIFDRVTAQQSSGEPRFFDVLERMVATLPSWCQ